MTRHAEISGGDGPVEIGYGGARSLMNGRRADEAEDEDEPYGRPNPEALSSHLERLVLLDDADDEPVSPEAWFVDNRNGFDGAHCITLVEQVGVDDLLDRLRAERTGGTSSFSEFREDASAGSADDEHALVGVAELGRWSILIESNGFAATRPERKQALSRGTRTVTLYVGMNSGSDLSVTVDGDERLGFSWMVPGDRRGSRPDDFDAAMRAAGLVLEEDAPPENEAASFVFVEHLTGVRLTVGLLDGLTLRTGRIDDG